MSITKAELRRGRSGPQPHLWFGLLFIAIGWPISWLQLPPALLRENAFLLLWVGYILTMDGLVHWRKGTSLLIRNRKAFIGLFLVSAVGWWVFEFFNRYLQNWEYLGTGKMSVLKYAVVATLHFTTVTPAIFETAELWSTTGFVQQFRGRRRVELTGTLLSNAIFFGVLAVVAVITVPRYAFPLVWLSVLLILDPLNYLREQPSLLAKLQKG
ncbi:MAG TPA: hypothetical protein EYP04_10590, partial [Anaerolineae bacterium]|nr:hypothetical protein [Anaerolineae bacterium]